MKRLTSWSIRSKLIWLTTAVAVAVITVVTAIDLWHGYNNQKQSLERELTAVGRMMADNVDASLVFNDPQSAETTLDALRGLPIVRAARILDRDGREFARYGDASAVEPWPSIGTAPPFSAQDGIAVVSTPISNHQGWQGELQIVASLDELETTAWQTLLAGIGVMIGATIAAWLLARILGHAISRPIEHLVSTMERVSKDGDFTLRATASSHDELGTLIDEFNNMIARIQLYNEELSEARDRAERANASKTRFLGTMSHELRTPLNAIIGFSELIESDMMKGDLKRYQEYGGLINNSGRHLLNLVGDLLDMSKLESHAYQLHEAEGDVHALIDDGIAMVQLQVGVKQITLSRKLMPDATMLRFDERAIRQVLVNLLGNAVKFTPSGGRVEIAEGVTEQGEYYLAISDTGPGISQEDLARVMEPFEQVRSHLSREHGGTGLGLAISRTLMELHGGRLTLSSELDVGTTVFMLLPRDRLITERSWDGISREELGVRKTAAGLDT
ncbi:MAG: HAMP domain-containing protein [Alphaproteobacteria bacterium]|nr:HAMP domain-containing protein [Alphaproteobacteria bacterium]